MNKNEEEKNTGSAKARRHFSNNSESQKQRALKLLKSYASQPLNDGLMVTETTADRCH